MKGINVIADAAMAAKHVIAPNLRQRRAIKGNPAQTMASAARCSRKCDSESIAGCRALARLSNASTAAKALATANSHAVVLPANVRIRVKRSRSSGSARDDQARQTWPDRGGSTSIGMQFRKNF
jgi:hypothetical protein